MYILSLSTGCPKVECLFWNYSCSKTVRHIGRKWCFLKSQDYIFWYSSLTFSKKKKEMKKFLIWKKKLFFFGQNFFSKFCWKFFFALNQPKKGFEVKKKPIISKKNLWYNFFLFKMKIFIISFISFAKVRHEYENILAWLFKKHHFQSIWLTVLLQEHFQKTHFTFGHPVHTKYYINKIILFFRCWYL